MLQWMGGSRRKVSTSRKSTHSRQRQYFEQKKRRQQQTSGLHNNVDEANVCGQNHEKPKSLDILSFLNLSTAAQECKSSLTNELDSSCYEVEYVYPQKAISSSPVNVPSSRNLSSNQNGDGLDNQKAETEQQLSIFDLLVEDGPNENSEGSPVHEAHVAFSVEGLGKMGIGTPVCSPQQPGSKFSLPKPMKQYHSSKDRDYMNDLELELSSMVHDVDIPPSSDPLELPLKKRGVKVFSSLSGSEEMTTEGRMPFDTSVWQRDNFFNKDESPFINIDSERLRRAAPCFLDETFPDESMDNATWKNQGHHSDILRDETQDVFDFTSEYSSFSARRNVAKGLGDFDISESAALHLKHQSDHDFINIDAKRCSAASESWDFSPLVWSPFAAENAEDNMSLSEESSSSIAVKCGNAKYPSLNSILGKSPNEYECELWGTNQKAYSKKDLYAEQMKDKNRKLCENFLNGPGKHTRVINPSKKISFFQSDDGLRFQRDFDAQLSSSFGNDFTSMDIDSGLSSFQRTAAESNLSLERKYWSEDLSDIFPSSSLYPNQQSPCKKSKLTTPVKYAPSSSSLVSEKALKPQPFSPFQFDESAGLLNAGYRPRKPEKGGGAKMQSESPHSYHLTSSQEDIECPSLSGQGEISRSGKDESEIQQSGRADSSKDLERKTSVGNNEFSSENGKTVNAPCSRNSSKSMEAENETSEHSGQPLTIDSSDHGEVTSWAKSEDPDELGRHSNDIKYQFDGRMRSPYKVCNEGNEDKEDCGSENRKTGIKGHHNKNVSYQVMLESYVLQLLCVQKVLREASEQDPVKDV